MLVLGAVYNTPLPDPALLACLQCDLVQRLPALEPGGSARCPRCNRELERRREDSLNRTLALSLAAVALYVIANSVPMLGVAVAGHHSATTVFGGALQLWRDNEKIVAALVMFAAVVAPALQIAFMLTIALAAHRERPPHWIASLMRHHPVTRTWSMIEVMLLGVLVALIKVSEMATVIPGLALFALAALVLVFAAIQASFDSDDVWDRVEWASSRDGHGAAVRGEARAA